MPGEEPEVIALHRDEEAAKVGAQPAVGSVSLKGSASDQAA